MTTDIRRTSVFQKNDLPVIFAPLYRGAITGEGASSELLPPWAETFGTGSTFCRALVGRRYLSEEQMKHAASRYHLGMLADGAVIFWQIDQQGRTRDGKVMHYREDCHRDKLRHPTWISALMKRQAGYDGEICIKRCLFGLHLLPFVTGTVAIVEAEKTAVILSERFPGYVWMAAGGLNSLSAEKLLPLKEQRVVLFPDTDPDGSTYRKWHDIAREASSHFLCPIHVSPILEQRASPEQKTRKIDLVDFLYDR